MALVIRMVLYLVFGIIAGQGVGVWDADAGTFTLHVDSLATVIAGLAGFGGVFGASRVAKANGGLT